jgi:hypothetical protein
VRVARAKKLTFDDLCGVLAPYFPKAANGPKLRLLGVVKDHPERVPPALAQSADAVAHVDAIEAADGTGRSTRRSPRPMAVASPSPVV